jgi:HEAT repeat protein
MGSIAACDGSGSRLRRLSARGQTRLALGEYQRMAADRGSANPDALATLALGVLEHAAGAPELRLRNAAFTSLRSLGIRGREALVSLSERPGIVGDRAASVLYDVDGHDGEPPRRVLEASRSTDPERRIAGLAAFDGPSGGLGLLGALESRSSEVRRAAAQRLGRRRADRVVVDRLGQCVRDDPEESVRSACVNALGGQGPGAFEALTAAWRDRSDYVRMMSIAALVGANPERARTLLEGLLRQPATGFAVEYARSMASRGDEAAIVYLLDAMAGADPALRAQAAVAASSLVARHASRLRAFLDDGDVEVRLRVASAMARGASSGPALASLRAMAVAPRPSLAIRAVLVLAELRDGSIAPAVRRALQSSRPEVRRIAVLAWSHFAGGSGDADPLIPLLEDPDPLTRVMVAAEIVRIASR